MSTSPQPLSPAAILDLIHRNSIGNVHDVPVFSRSLHTKIQPLSTTATSVSPVVRSRAQLEALAIPGVRGGPNRRQTFGLSQTSGVFKEDPTLVRDVPNSDGLVAFLRDRAERERGAAILLALQRPAVVTVAPVVVATPHPVVTVPVTTTWQTIGEIFQKIGRGVFILCRAFMHWLIAQDLPTKTKQVIVLTRTVLGKGMQVTAKVMLRGGALLGKGSIASRSIGAAILRSCGYGVMAVVSVSAHTARASMDAFVRILRAAITRSVHGAQAVFRAIRRLDFSSLEFALFAVIERVVFFIPRTLARILHVLIPRMFGVLLFVVRLPVRLFQSLRRIRVVFPTRKRMTWAVGQAFTIGALVLALMTVGPIVRLQAGSWWEQLQYTLTGKAKEPAIRENLLDAVRPPEAIPPEEKQFQLVIPKINANMKVIANVDAGSEIEYSAALKKGVAHAKGSNLPGETEHGNRTIYIFGHSTNAVWNIEKYNALFYSLKDMTQGDDISVWFWGKEYHYTVKNVVKIDPSDVHYLQPQEDKDQLILQTCWPPGTTWKRLLVIAEPKEK